MKECRIGSLPWFAGVFWLTLAVLIQQAGWASFYARDVFAGFTLWACKTADWCNDRARECAIEGGAEE